MVLFIARLLLTLWVILAFRLTLGAKIAIAGVQPDLAAAFVFYLTLIRGPTMGILSGFVLGLLIDVDRPSGLGLSSLAWCTMAYVTTRARSAVDMTDRVISSAMLFLMVLLAETIRTLVIGGIDPARVGMIWIRWALPTALYTGIAVPLLILATRSILGRTRWFSGES